MARRLQTLDGVAVTELSGIGRDAANALAEVDVHSVLDLLTYYPRRWIDRTKEAKIADLPVGEQGLVVAEVRAIRTPPSRGRGKARGRGGRPRRHRADDVHVLQPTVAGAPAEERHDS